MTPYRWGAKASALTITYVHTGHTEKACGYKLCSIFTGFLWLHKMYVHDSIAMGRFYHKYLSKSQALC